MNHTSNAGAPLAQKHIKTKKLLFFLAVFLTLAALEPSGDCVVVCVWTHLRCNDYDQHAGEQTVKENNLM